MTDSITPDDIAALREGYAAAVGKRPFMGWDADELRKRLAEATGANGLAPKAPSPPVTVLLVCNHVYLPRDPTAEGWDSSIDTIRYDGMVGGKRTRVDCHPDLAATLQRSGQGEIL